MAAMSNGRNRHHAMQFIYPASSLRTQGHTPRLLVSGPQLDDFHQPRTAVVMGPCVRRDDGYSISVNCRIKLRWIIEKLSSETSVRTVSPAGVTWASIASMLSNS